MRLCWYLMLLLSVDGDEWLFRIVLLSIVVILLCVILCVCGNVVLCGFGVLGVLS